MIAATLGVLVGAVAMYVLGHRIDLGVLARRERDTAVSALRELVGAAYSAKPGSKPTARESRAWARALSVLACHPVPTPQPGKAPHGR